MGKLPLELRQDILIKAADDDAATFAALQCTSREVRSELLDSPFVKKKRQEAALLPDYDHRYYDMHKLEMRPKVASHLMFLDDEHDSEVAVMWKNNFAKGVREVLEKLEHINNSAEPQIDKGKQRGGLLYESFKMPTYIPKHYQFPSCFPRLKRKIIHEHFRYEENISQATVEKFSNDPGSLTKSDWKHLARLTLQKNQSCDRSPSQDPQIAHSKSLSVEQFFHLGKALDRLTMQTKKELLDYALSPSSYHSSIEHEATMVGALAQGARHLAIDDHQKLLSAASEIKSRFDSGQVSDEVYLKLISNLALGLKNSHPDRQFMKDQVFDMNKEFYDANPQRLLISIEKEKDFGKLVSIYPYLNTQQRIWIKNVIKKADLFPDLAFDADGVLDEDDPWYPVVQNTQMDLDAYTHNDFRNDIVRDFIKRAFIKSFVPILPEMKQECPKGIDDLVKVLHSMEDDVIFVKSTRLFFKSGLDNLTQKQLFDIEERLKSIEGLQSQSSYMEIDNIPDRQILSIEKRLKSVERIKFMGDLQGKSSRVETSVNNASEQRQILSIEKRLKSMKNLRNQPDFMNEEIHKTLESYFVAKQMMEIHRKKLRKDDT